MNWKKLRGIPLPYEKQVYIHSCCLLYDEQPEFIRKKIDRLCDMCGGPYSAALYDVMCTKNSITSISIKHNVSENLLYQVRRAFYINWDGRRSTPSTPGAPPDGKVP